jgi:hypothetical protein
MQVLPDDFGNFLSMLDYSKIKLFGPLNHIVTCKIGFNDANRDKVKIGNGWKKFCTLNNIIDGTCLCNIANLIIRSILIKRGLKGI